MLDLPSTQEPRLEVDEGLECDCPRMIGLEWIALPSIETGGGGIVVPIMYLATPPAELSGGR